ALGGCQQATQGSPASKTADVALYPALPADPACPDDVTAMLSSGVVVRFMGSIEADPDICVQQWNGRSYRYYLGFWGDGRFEHGPSEQRKTVAAMLRGPVGTTATVELQGPTTGALWKSATVTHEADASLQVGGHKRPVVKLRIVRSDALGRSDVTAERLYW